MYKGSCHCGAVKFSVTTETREVLDCNCSMCSRKGYLHLIVERSEFTILSGEERLREYQFGTKSATHYFCNDCGIHPFYIPRSHPEGYSVNFRCLDRYPELKSEFATKPFDGQNWEKKVHTIR